MSSGAAAEGDAPGPATARFGALLARLRPRLHRYCARMTGSVFDGEDALQDGLTRAAEAFDPQVAQDNPEGWVFRIVHNAALDFLRKRARQPAHLPFDEAPPMANPRSEIDERLGTAASLRTLMELPTAQRSCVVLMDVLGHSLGEIEAITGSSVPSIKAALHRGRARLRELVARPDPPPAALPGARERQLLATYVERFNARDFDAVRDLLAEEVRLEVVARTVLRGKAAVTSGYFANYAAATDWRFEPALVEGRLAMMAFPPLGPVGPAAPAAAPRYFVLLAWEGGLVTSGRDFRHAPYITDGATFQRL